MERYNGWMYYSFDGGPINGNKQHPHARFDLHLKKGFKVKQLNYFDALFYNAEMVRDNFNGPFDVFFSGGIDSEIVVRVNQDLGIKQNVVIIRMEDNHNIQDVTYALEVCKCLNIKPTIIDWNLRRFIENDAQDYYNKSFSPILAMMARWAWFDLVDNTPVFAAGEPFWRREVEDYSVRANDMWKLYWTEDGFASSFYANISKRTVVGEWYNYTPEVALSFHHLPDIKNLLADQFPGMKNSEPLRLQIHKYLWDDIIPRPKFIGYEGVNAPRTYPDFMDAFQREVVAENVKTRNTRYKYTVQQLENIFNG